MACAGATDWQAWNGGQPSPAQAHGQLGGFDAAATSAMATPPAEPSTQPEPEPAMPEGAPLSGYTLLSSLSDAVPHQSTFVGLALYLRTQEAAAALLYEWYLHCLIAKRHLYIHTCSCFLSSFFTLGEGKCLMPRVRLLPAVQRLRVSLCIMQSPHAT